MPALGDLLGEDDIARLEKTPFEWLMEAEDEDFRSLVKENILGVVVFGLYFYVVARLMQIAVTDPSQMWPWFWQFMAQVVLVFFGIWMVVLRWKGGALILDADFYRPDGTRASGQVMLADAPLTVPIEYLRDSIEKLRRGYEEIERQQLRQRYGRLKRDRARASSAGSSGTEH